MDTYNIDVDLIATYSIVSTMELKNCFDYGVKNYVFLLGKITVKPRPQDIISHISRPVVTTQDKTSQV